MIDIAELRRLHEAATPGDLTTAEHVTVLDVIECPVCQGDGEVDAKDYCNIDHKALGVQFYGVGHEFGAHEALWSAVMRSLPALLDRIEAERSAIVAYIRAEASRCYAAGTGCLADAVTAEGDALTAIAAEIEVGNHLPAAPTTGGANA